MTELPLWAFEVQLHGGLRNTPGNGHTRTWSWGIALPIRWGPSRHFWQAPCRLSPVPQPQDSPQAEKLKILRFESLVCTHCCCSVALSCPTLCDHMVCSTPAFPVLHYLPELAQTHIHWVGDAIQPSHPLSPPSPPALNLSQHQGFVPISQLFASGGHSVGASASASVLPMNIQGWFPLRLTGFWTNFPDSSNGKESAYNAGDLGSIPGSRRSPEKENPQSWGALRRLVGKDAALPASAMGVGEQHTRAPRKWSPWCIQGWDSLRPGM